MHTDRHDTSSPMSTQAPSPAPHDHTQADSHDGHDHDHHGHHHQLPDQINRVFILGIALNVLFVVIEVSFGLWSNSIALLSDAAHNLSDVLGLLIAWGASVLSRHAASQHFTYGLRSSTILAALMNAAFLILMTLLILWEALPRLVTPEHVNGEVLIWVALAGVVINGLTALLFLRGQTHDLNQRGAFLHMAADTVVSLGVVIAGIIIVFTHWNWLDPLISLVIGFVILIPAWRLLKQAARLILHGVPEGVNPDEVFDYLKHIRQVTDVHDLHIWALSTTENALTAHLIVVDGLLNDALRESINHELSVRFNINHTTLQIESGDDQFPCARAHGCPMSLNHSA
ncbi:MAG TPA: cation diffusion facilitator family transporter [Halothiobacillus sp.]|nr:cation diffusion facilitator family transporter [Halothiobacillus sp.]